MRGYDYYKQPSKPIYDYLVVGAGLWGCTFAHEAKKHGKKVCVIEKRPYIGGDCHTQEMEGIHVHMHGPHIFHCSQKYLWDYINQFATFNNFQLRVKAFYKDRLYSFPINLSTMHEVWGVTTPAGGKQKISESVVKFDSPKNFEEFALSQIGEEMYRMFIYGYTKKVWNKEPKLLPTSIIKRLPYKLHHCGRHYPDSDMYEGVPIGGYTQIFEKMLDGIDCVVNTDFFQQREEFESLADKIVYTGSLDHYFNFEHGALEYRSLRYELERHEGDYQGHAQINFTDEEVPWIRIIEHKHFEFKAQLPYTYISREYPEPYNGVNLPYYPVNDETNNRVHKKYLDMAKATPNLIVGGRLGEYRYQDMDIVLASALNAARKEFA